MATRYYDGPPSDHFDGTRFFNPGHPSTDRGLLALLRWRLGGSRVRWEPAGVRAQAVPEARVDGLRITMVGHSSLLVQAAGCNILVDPVWSERASPVGFAGPRRAQAPGIAFGRLPKIDAVLLTHDHYDHMDLATLARLWERDRPQVVAPLGNDVVVARSHPEIAVDTHDWRQRAALGHGAAAWLHPAHHWSARGPADRRKALWCGYVVETAAGTVYLAGDTGYGDGRIFRELAARHPVVDVAVLPIGAYAPRWFMKEQHVDPAEAVQIMQDCGARQALGVHWGTFQLTDEAREEPVRLLREAMARAGLDQGRFLALEAGQVWDRAG